MWKSYYCKTYMDTSFMVFNPAFNNILVTVNIVFNSHPCDKGNMTVQWSMSKPNPE